MPRKTTKASTKAPAKSKDTSGPSDETRDLSINSGRFHDPTSANTTAFNREPSATEAKLAEQGLIPPIRRM